MKIGILGGTFSPIHFGHLFLAENVRDALSLDKMLFIPTGESYMKRDVISREHRANMTNLAISDNPFFTLSDLEIRKEGPSYTAETLNELHLTYPDTQLFFICGTDTLFQIELWRNPEEVFKSCTLCVCKRDKQYSDCKIENKKKELIEKFGAEIILLDCSVIEISSSEIRNRIKSEQSIKYYVPDSVMSYIYDNKLYMNSEEPINEN